ncbi:efflux RND transporter permease subunit [Zavarzinella formosa]|uniref:efflux RND transporter permease subunit n=1 Tax=Zavarzinella formosa TaxID=360055 RepID=UPI00035F350B|nr:efflux RND transporter permease subunit [Zavarzinella formosa]
MRAFLRRLTPSRLWPLGVAVVLLVAAWLAHIAGPQHADPAPSDNITQAEVTFQVRPSPGDQPPQRRGEVVRVRLDVARLRDNDLSRDDVMKAFVESGVVGSSRRADPPPGVVYVTHLARPEQYEKLIVKADAEGKIVRLKDIGRVELVADGGAQEAEPGATADGGGM